MIPTFYKGLTQSPSRAFGETSKIEISPSPLERFTNRSFSAGLGRGEVNGLPAVIPTFYEGLTQSPSRAFGAGGVLHRSLSKASFLRSQCKTPFQLRWKGVCAQNWIRTSTPLRALRPEHSASTNFAIWADKPALLQVVIQGCKYIT